MMDFSFELKLLFLKRGVVITTNFQRTHIPLRLYQSSYPNPQCFLVCRCLFHTYYIVYRMLKNTYYICIVPLVSATILPFLSTTGLILMGGRTSISEMTDILPMTPRRSIGHWTSPTKVSLGVSLFVCIFQIVIPKRTSWLKSYQPLDNSLLRCRVVFVWGIDMYI